MCSMYGCWFPGNRIPGSKDTIPRSWSRLLISPECVPFTGVTGVRSPAGVQRGEGRSPASPRHHSRPMPGPHRPADDWHSWQWRAKNVEKRLGEHNPQPGKRNGHWPRDNGPGNHNRPIVGRFYSSHDFSRNRMNKGIPVKAIAYSADFNISTIRSDSMSSFSMESKYSAVRFASSTTLFSKLLKQNGLSILSESRTAFQQMSWNVASPSGDHSTSNTQLKIKIQSTVINSTNTFPVFKSWCNNYHETKFTTTGYIYIHTLFTYVTK